MDPRTPQNLTLKVITYNLTGESRAHFLPGQATVDRSLFGFIIRYSKRDQLLIVPLVLATMVVYYLSLDLPKTIINQAIQGAAFKEAATTRWFGLDLERLPYLLGLSILFLALIVLNGWLKFQINTMK